MVMSLQLYGDLLTLISDTKIDLNPQIWAQTNLAGNTACSDLLNWFLRWLKEVMILI